LLPDGAVATPMAPQECIDVPGAEAIDSLVIWLWNESRRISPSVTMSSPAASWRETASSTARSSMDLNWA
jgi:hypothetical protein